MVPWGLLAGRDQFVAAFDEGHRMRLVAHAGDDEAVAQRGPDRWGADELVIDEDRQWLIDVPRGESTHPSTAGRIQCHHHGDIAELILREARLLNVVRRHEGALLNPDIAIVCEGIVLESIHGVIPGWLDREVVSRIVGLASDE